MHSGHHSALPPQGEFHHVCGSRCFPAQHALGGYFATGGACMTPPGVWSTSPHAHFPHHELGRSRSPWRTSLDYIGSALSASRPSDFPKIFNKLPPALRAVAIEAPDDVITDIKSIVNVWPWPKESAPQRKQMSRENGVKRRNWHEQESKRCQDKWERDVKSNRQQEKGNEKDVARCQINVF